MRPPRPSHRANEAVPAFRGQLNGQPFESLPRRRRPVRRGAGSHGPRPIFLGRAGAGPAPDDEPPRFPRDLLFIPAHLELEDEQGDIFLPALYPGSHEHPDDQVRLGRMTDWKELDGGPPWASACIPTCTTTTRSACSNGGNGSRTTNPRTSRGRNDSPMSRISSQEGLKPSIIDRLIDPDSDGTSWRRGYSIEQVIDSVRQAISRTCSIRTRPGSAYPRGVRRGPQVRSSPTACPTWSRIRSAARTASGGSARPSRPRSR